MMIMIILFLLTVSLVPILYWQYVLYKNKSLHKIPGPDPTPLLGNIFSRDPYELMRDMKKLMQEYGPVFRIYAGPDIKIFFAKPEPIEYILTSNIHINKPTSFDAVKPYFGEGLAVSGGKKWKARRKIITPAFHFKILDKYFDYVKSATSTLIELLHKEIDKKSVDVYEYITLYTLDVICESAMGAKVNAQMNKEHYYVRAVRKSMEIIMIRFFAPWLRSELILGLFPKLYKDHTECVRGLNSLPHEVIVERRKKLSQINKTNIDEDSFEIKGKKSLIDLLLASQESKHLTNEDIQEEIAIFMVAGNDTTASAISFTLLHLTNHPEVQKKLYQEIVSAIGAEGTDDLRISQLNDLQYLDMVLKESLRITPSVPFIERKIEEDCVIEGIKYPKGTTVVTYIYGLHHNPDIYPDPEKFDPERFTLENQRKRHNFAYVPFSAGPRNCIGQKFALNEIKYAIVKVLQNFELLPVPGFKEILGTAMIIKSKNGVLVRFKKRN